MKTHELSVETRQYAGRWTEFRGTCSCGWGPRISEEIEYLTATWLSHERNWAKEAVIELQACIRDAAKLIGPDSLSAEDVARWHRWADRLVVDETGETS